MAIAEIFAVLVQYAGPTSIQNSCNQLLSTEGDSLDKLIAYIRRYYGNDCIDDYDEFIRIYGAIENTNDACKELNKIKII